jgi:hypothetical protein
MAEDDTGNDMMMRRRKGWKERYAFRLAQRGEDMVGNVWGLCSADEPSRMAAPREDGNHHYHYEKLPTCGCFYD